MQNAPIAIFAFNRPAHLRNLFASLRECEGFSQSPITVFIDGPRSPRDEPLVAEVRAVVQGLGLANVSSSVSPENRGLRRSIYAGVSALCEQYGRVIVLEDDLVLSPIALTYFNRALDHYAEDQRVWSISGYVYDTPAYRDLGRTLILPYAHSWGWATWQRAWQHFELDARPAQQDLDSAAFRRAFDMNGLYPFTAMLKNSLSGLVNSWYAHWYYTIFRHGGRSVFPPRRVVENFGLSEGTHGGSLNPHERLVARPPLLDQLIAFADAAEVDYHALDLIRRSREARVQRLIARAGAIKRKLARLSG